NRHIDVWALPWRIDYLERNENAIAFLRVPYQAKPMHQKELRIALVCYGGVSLAVYMHGVTKELWKTLQASRAFWAG
ncbi:hypothetical protein ACP3WW_24125, partial [Salmonella enterica]